MLEIGLFSVKFCFDKLEQVVWGNSFSCMEIESEQVDKLLWADEI